MKKRLLCLLMGLLMVLSVAFTACSNSDDDGADVTANTGAKTITMRLITEKKVFNTKEELASFLKNECGGDANNAEYKEMKKTCDAYWAVEEEFSKITKSKYKINVDLIFYTEDEYYTTLEETMEKYALEQKVAEEATRALEKYIKEYTSVYPDYPTAAITESFKLYFPEYAPYIGGNKSGSTGDTYKKNELGIPELVYPEADENQIDIIYISGEDMYMRYKQNGWLVGLNEHLATTGSKLNYYITPALLSGVRIDGEAFAIPNNVQMGEYTYMLVDRELADRYKYTYESFEDLVDCKNFLDDIRQSEKDVLPIDSSFKECMDLFVWYWNIDMGKNELGGNSYSINKENNFSLVGAVYGDPANAGRGKIDLGFNTLFTQEEYREIFLCLKEYEFNGLYKTENDTREGAAVSFMTGNYSLKKAAEANDGVCVDENGKEYYMYVAKYPQADEDALYGNMFGVSANSKNAEACMRVITLLNTDPEVRNLLQYGIKQGENAKDQEPNYAIDEDTGVLKRLNNYYMMDIEKTGNCFIAYPEEGLPADYWEDAKVQSNETLIDPLLGFDFDTRLAKNTTVLDNALLEFAAMLAEQKLAEIEKCETYEELYELVETEKTGLRDTLSGNPELTYVTEKGETMTVAVNFAKLTNKTYDVGTGANGEPDMSGDSPYAVYYSWLVEFKYVPAD